MCCMVCSLMADKANFCSKLSVAIAQINSENDDSHDDLLALALRFLSAS